LRFLAVISIIFLFFDSSAQENVDSTIRIKSNQFLEDLKSRKGKLNAVAFNSDFKGVNIKSPFLKSLGFELLKLPGNNLILHFYRSGKLYKLDTASVEDSLLFRRIDNTTNYNYNIGSILFSVRNEIYEIGGYGFWKSNGVLRKFNFKDREWDVVVLNQEIFPQGFANNGTVSWIDSTERYFYVPFQRPVNDGILDQGDMKDFVLEGYRLDINKGQWEILGKTDKEAFQIFKNAPVLFSSNTGVLLTYTSRVYHFDYTKNQISVNENPSLAQSLSRLNNSFIHYFHGDWVYWYNSYNQRYDSIYVDRGKFIPLSTPIWKKNWTLYYVVGALLLTIVLLTVFIRWRLGSRSAVKNTGLGTEGTSTLAHPFTETELTLLLLLVEKTQKGFTATISEINYVLGIKDKNPGMQKKVRSDVINSINEKFRLLHKETTQLIQSIRSEADKRYFEYLINPDLLSELQKLIG
jgi:hypothetical protein